MNLKFILTTVAAVVSTRLSLTTLFASLIKLIDGEYTREKQEIPLDIKDIKGYNGIKGQGLEWLAFLL